jgi:acylglycerol lipase
VLSYKTSGIFNFAYRALASIAAYVFGAVRDAELVVATRRPPCRSSSSAVAPNLALVKLDPSGLSRDPKVVREYARDPLVFHGRVAVRPPAELLASARRVTPRLESVATPLLLIHGGADPVAAPGGSRMIRDRAGFTDKTLNFYPGLFHDILNEPERDEVFADVLAWPADRV